jgi:hypothetical protein
MSHVITDAQYSRYDTPRRRRHARTTPNWLKVVYLAVGAFLVIVTLALILAPSKSSTSIPACEVEDGSTQSVCIFHGHDGDYINFHHGRDYVKVGH